MSVLTRVRNTTRAVHKSLDNHPLLLRFMQSGNVVSYRGFLEAFRSVVTLELHHADEYLEAADAELIDYKEWREALEKDLLTMERLHQDAYIPNISTLVPAINSRSEFWGFL